MEMLHGQIVALYLFDIAEAIDLHAAASAISSSVRATFAPKPATPAYVRYQAAAAAVRRRRRRHPVDRRFPRRLQGVRLRRHLAAADARVRRHLAGSGGRVGAARRKRSARTPGRGGVPQRRRTSEARDDRSAADSADRGLSRVCDQRARAVRIRPTSSWSTMAMSSRRAARRARGAQPPGAGRDSPPSDLVPRDRSGRADVERGLRVRYSGRRAGRTRDCRVRQLPAPAIPLLRRAARQRAGEHLRQHQEDRRAGTTPCLDGTTRARRGRSTRSSST